MPLLARSKPYEQICFQYSLHRGQQCRGGQLQHVEFLADDTAWFKPRSGEAREWEDPQLSFIRSLIHHLGEGEDDYKEGAEGTAQGGGEGSILVFNKSFEDARLKSLALKFPSFEPAVTRIRGRLVDLATPFQRMHVYRSYML